MPPPHLVMKQGCSWDQGLIQFTAMEVTCCLLLISTVAELSKAAPATCWSRAARHKSSERNEQWVVGSDLSSILPSPLFGSGLPLWSLWELKALWACKQGPWRQSLQAAHTSQILWPKDIAEATGVPSGSQKPRSYVFKAFFLRRSALSCLLAKAPLSSLF